MKDRIFQETLARPEDFQFSPKVAEVFDDMLVRSVPFYKETIAMITRILEGFLAPRALVYDLGCSTGTTLIELARRLEHLDLQLVGVDSSPAMIEKAVLKAEVYSKKEHVQFVEADILSCVLREPSAILLNYTLQFVRPLQRQAFVQRLYDSLQPGGVLVVCEKTIAESAVLNRSFIDFYLDFKRGQGYSEIEIAQKREALENVLVPFAAGENIKMLRQAGFKEVEQFFQWFNFSSFVAIK